MIQPTIRASLLVTVLVCCGTPAARADATNSWGAFSGSLAFTTNYNFRGLTRSRDDPAVQGVVRYTHPSGVYADLWASNVELSTPGRHDDAKIETDWSLGLSNTIGKWTYDVGVVYNLFPGASDSAHDNYYELYGGLTYDLGIAAFSGSVHGSTDYSARQGSGVYYNAYGSVPLPFLPYNFALSGWVGYQTYVHESRTVPGYLGRLGVRNYVDWSVGFGATVYGIGLDLRWVDTNLSSAQCGANTCKGTAVFTLSKYF